MKRIKYACLEQTIHFQLKDGLEHAAAVQAVQGELAHYKAQLDRTHTKYRILEEIPQPDGSILVKIKKQYNNHNCGPYLD